jgi:predicted acylesterase/phospholipase RssA
MSEPSECPTVEPPLDSADEGNLFCRESRGRLPRSLGYAVETFPSRLLARPLGFGHARALFVLLILLAVGACAQFDRLPAVGVADTDRASVAGIAEARFPSNDSAAMAAFGQRLHERESNYFASLGRPIPPESLLAISGGGDNGAFGAGVLVGWSESGTRPSFKIVTGISTGALIAPLAFVGRDYDPLLAGMYTTIDQTDIFEKRPIVAGFLSDALADTTPLQHLLEKYVDAKLVARIAEESKHGRALVIITTNLDAGVPVVWNIGAIAESGRPEAIGLIRKILLASASVPGFFPPVMFDVVVDGVAHQEMHVDGGASMQTFLYPAALQVKKIPNGGGTRPRTAYVIRNGRLTESWDEVARSTPAIATRAVATLTVNSGVGDLYRIYALAKRDGVRLRLAYIEDDFEQPHPAEFDRQYMTKLFEYGRAKAQAGYPWHGAPPGF